ncbi:regulatory protein YrvL [Melghiribacillus thermohalophilus]|uniref:Regulatory protein YrvL n=1 Tax=Melghiribacillus thermohalophilus TaxID=1324956 RepID=A0A4R3MWS0_9BACI|nr:YrvL family regulatory protein [Melghiribacillus thermohalophilus]TCT19966.1 regulatory protein YrvL [Melghiribacillus thermohalophilus]
MSEHHDRSFRDMDLKTKIATIAGIVLLIIMAIGFVLGLFFFGFAGAFEILGVYYTSPWSLAVFVVGFFILSFMIELVFKVIFYVSVRNQSEPVKLLFTRIFVEVASNWLVLFIVDEMMKSITISLKAEIILALLLAVIETVFDGKKIKPGHNGDHYPK